MADAPETTAGDHGAINSTETEDEPMYATARIADALITPPIPSPQPRYVARADDEEPPVRSTTSVRQVRRTIEGAAAAAWLAFVPRMRNNPR